MLAINAEIPIFHRLTKFLFYELNRYDCFQILAKSFNPDDFLAQYQRPPVNTLDSIYLFSCEFVCIFGGKIFLLTLLTM